MEFVQWTNQYSVGDPLMDAYHHIFFTTIQNLAKELDTLPPRLVEERIAFLLNYASMHFDSEEKLMEELAYPDLEAHKEVHQAFKERLMHIQSNYLATPSVSLAEQLLAISQDWLSKHIMEEDMKYKPFLG